MLVAEKNGGYRSEHLGKGADYHATFRDNPRRALLWTIEQRILKRIARRYLSRARVEHLDFACGTGRIVGLFRDYAASSTGVDVSGSMLKEAKSAVADVEWIEADITREPVLAGRQFDLITAFRFFPNAEPALRSEAVAALAPLLRSDGVFVFNNHRNTSSLGFRVARFFRPGVPVRGMTMGEADALVQSAGLTIERVYHVGVVPEYETRYVRPRFLVAWIERLATHLPVASLSEDQIFVCRKGNVRSP